LRGGRQSARAPLTRGSGATRPAAPERQPIIQSVLAAHPTEVERYRSGKTGILGFLVAQVMKQAGMGGKANPKLVNVMLARELGSS
jgi:Asp-tRNA(Asn)/Glu-tRNA(Gln) amidotransferase B subunit